MMYLWGLHHQMILGATRKIAVAWLLVGPPVTYKSKVITQRKSDTLVPQVRGWA